MSGAGGGVADVLSIVCVFRTAVFVGEVGDTNVKVCGRSAERPPFPQVLEVTSYAFGSRSLPII